MEGESVAFREGSPSSRANLNSHVASVAAGNAGVPVNVNGFCYGQASGMAPRARIAVYPTVGTLADVISAMDQVNCANILKLIFQARPTFGYRLLEHRLVLAKDAINPIGSFLRTPAYVEECQSPLALDARLVTGSIVVCRFSEEFYNGTSTLYAIVNTARTLGFMGFVLVANPEYGSFIAEPVPFPVSGILVPNVTDSQVILRYIEELTFKDARGFPIRLAARAAIGKGRAAAFGGQEPIVSRFSSRGPNFIDMVTTPADVLKPYILEPGHQIWGAWSPMSAKEPALAGQSYALLSGTSMATPHVAGISALIKQYHPSWTPSMIASAISTTATKYDKKGELIMAEGFGVGTQYPSTHFDSGAGLVSPSNALDPGLVLSSGYEDYISFLCSLHDTDSSSVKTFTGELCAKPLDHPANLNLPSVTISALNVTLTVRRVFTNVGSKPETCTSSTQPPAGTIVGISTPLFTIAPQGTQEVVLQFNVTQAVN